MPRTTAETNRGLTTIFRTMANRKDQYKEGVSKNHQICKGLADRLTTGGGIKDDLLQFNKGSAGDGVDEGGKHLIPEEEFLTFFEEQENRLRALAENNAKRDRQVDAFAGAILKLQEKISNDNSAGAEEQENEFETMIQDSMEEEMKRLNAEGDIKKTGIFKEICNLLGDKDASDKQGDDEDEIEVMRNDDDNKNKCKCPFTATWMEDPVRNKACGHTYSREGIMAHIRATKNGNAMCPLPGCDKAVLQKDLESDMVTARLVKRFKRQAAAEEEQRKMTQCLDDTMEEED